MQTCRVAAIYFHEDDLMKNATLLMLPLAISASLLLGACDRDKPADPAPVAAESAPMPAEAAPAAPVADPMPMDNKSFADMDKNADGGISHDELADSEMLDQHFETADTDKDGKLSSAEVDKHRADMGMPVN